MRLPILINGMRLARNICSYTIARVNRGLRSCCILQRDTVCVCVYICSYLCTRARAHRFIIFTRTHLFAILPIYFGKYTRPPSPPPPRCRILNIEYYVEEDVHACLSRVELREETEYRKMSLR